MLSPRISDMIEEIKNQQEKTESTASHGYFLGHKCYLSKSKISGPEIKCSRLRRFILDLTSVQMADIRARRLYRSYAEICTEKYRQYKFYPYSLHPYSRLRVCLEVFFRTAMVTTNILMAIHYSATRPMDNGEKLKKCPLVAENNSSKTLHSGAGVAKGYCGSILSVHHGTNFSPVRVLNSARSVYRNIPMINILNASLVYSEYALLILDIIFTFNIFIEFFTGYTTGYSCKVVVLDLKLILINYTGSWLLLDLASISYMLHRMFLINYKNNITLELILTSMRILRIPKLYIYLENLLTSIQAGAAKEMVAKVTFFLAAYLTWNIYFQYATEYIIEESYSPVMPRNCSWITIGKLWNHTSTVRFIYSFDRAVGMLRGNANLNLLEENGCFEVFFMIAWLIAKVIVLHCAFKYIILILGSESARAKYFIMAKQVETYMHQRRYPPRLKNKILKFYMIRFQSHFFVETRMMSSVTGQLKEDILMHTGRQLVRDVAFMKQMPRSLLLQIGISLRVVIFIAGDIIMKINTTGDCLYFIHKGTVAIYSESGKEVCHLEDGDFFGEIALVMKHRLRTASAVAVTNCELFKLDRKDFESSVASYPTVYEDIKKIATDRLEQTVMLDDHHKTELKMKAGRPLENTYNNY